MMILAAIDDAATSQPVLATAQRLGALLGARAEAVHVRVDGRGEAAAAAAAAAAAGVPLRIRDGDVVAELRSEMRERQAVALVIGARDGPAGAAGHLALEIVQTFEDTVVVVPPDVPDRPLRRVLVAVEGDGESAGLRRLFDHLGDRPLPEVIALHVIEPEEIPPFADSPIHETNAFEREFRIRVASGLLTDAARIRFEMRVGDAAEVLREATRELDVDLVVLVWHRDLSGGHGRLVREMLERGSIPVALFALDDG